MSLNDFKEMLTLPETWKCSFSRSPLWLTVRQVNHRAFPALRCVPCVCVYALTLHPYSSSFSVFASYLHTGPVGNRLALERVKKSEGSRITLIFNKMMWRRHKDPSFAGASADTARRVRQKKAGWGVRHTDWEGGGSTAINHERMRHFEMEINSGSVLL